MKDSKEYSAKIKKLYRSLKRKFPKPVKLKYEDPIDALVYGIISSNMSESAANASVKKIASYFVDLNELRVSKVEEIAGVLAGNDADAQRPAAGLINALGSIFEKYDSISLDSVKKLGKRPARQELEKIDSINNFVIDYCMLTAIDSHAVPLTAVMIDYLKSNDFVHPDSDENEISGFLSRQIAFKDVYEFYSLLRHESESTKKKRVKAKKTAKAKETKKTKKAKKTKEVKKVKKTKKTKK